MIQEFAIWPPVMAIGPAAKVLPPPDLVIDEAVLTFLSRYKLPGPAQGASTVAKRGAKARGVAAGAPPRKC